MEQPNLFGLLGMSFALAKTKYQSMMVPTQQPTKKIHGSCGHRVETWDFSCKKTTCAHASHDAVLLRLVVMVIVLGIMSDFFIFDFGQ